MHCNKTTKVKMAKCRANKLEVNKFKSNKNGKEVRMAAFKIKLSIFRPQRNNVNVFIFKIALPQKYIIAPFLLYKVLISRIFKLHFYSKKYQ